MTGCCQCWISKLWKFKMKGIFQQHFQQSKTFSIDIWLKKCKKNNWIRYTTGFVIIDEKGIWILEFGGLYFNLKIKKILKKLENNWAESSSIFQNFGKIDRFTLCTSWAREHISYIRYSLFLIGICIRGILRIVIFKFLRMHFWVSSD
jgi:hypothetical protein